eukprot:SM000027S09567  [mRNA]  locus=s27:32911:34821:- [translate_table: standard]
MAAAAAAASGGGGGGSVGEDPYRLVDGRKVYLDEADVVALLAGEAHLQPFDPGEYDASAYLWKKLAAIPEERRPRLLDLLEPRHLCRMWELAGQRQPGAAETAAGMLPDPLVDTPLVPEVWDGLVFGLPMPLRWLGRFQKAFFVGSNQQLYGRVLSGGLLLSPVASIVAPLYFQAREDVVDVAATEEVCELSLEYGDGQLALARPGGGGLPPSFPMPRRHPHPFSDAMYDHVRAAGPGVLVGQSWQEGRQPDALPRKYLSEFVLVRRLPQLPP